MCVCVCVLRESVRRGCNYFQLGVHYEYVLETSSFGFSTLGAIVCIFNVMLIQFVVYLVVYVSLALCRLWRNCVSMKVGRECRPGSEDMLLCGVLQMLVISQSVILFLG